MEDQPIRILQRPCTNASETIGSGSIPIVKTLEQKAAEYAAARERIMGVDYKPEIPVSDRKAQVRVPKEAVTQPIQQSVVSTSVATPTPLMSIQATPYNLTNTNVPSASVSQRSSVGISNIQKSANQLENANRTVPRMQPLPHGRILSSSASSPSLYMFSRSRQQTVPLCPAQPRTTTNAGLLPTPGFNCTTPNLHMNTGISHSQSAALSLMHQFTLFQQQNNQQLMNGLNSSFSPSAIYAPNVNQVGYASAIPPPNGAVKHAHSPPTFN